MSDERDRYWGIKIRSGKPMELIQLDAHESPAENAPAQRHADQLRVTLKAYLETVQDLLKGKYAAVKHMLPPYLAEPGNLVAFRCDDGIIIRIDPRSGERKTLVGRLNGSIKELTYGVSEGVAHCTDSRDFKPEKPGISIKLQIAAPTGETKRELGDMCLTFHAILERPEQLPSPPAKPFCLLSVQNQWEVALVGEERGNDGHPRPFVTRTPMRFDCLGWDLIEVYPFTSPDDWKPEYAPVWAETDILAAVVAHQTRESEFQSLDPYAAARAQKQQVLNEYRDLLDSNPEREETLQAYLAKHPELLCPAYSRCMPKVALGDKVSDFVFQTATGEYLLVELERSTQRLFLSGKRECDPSAELNHARSQIGDWKRYLEDNLSTVQKELGLTGISSNPRSLIVMGRSASLNENQRRKLVAMVNEAPTTTILTYDDVLHTAKTTIENILGPLRRSAGQTEVYYPKPNS